MFNLFINIINSQEKKKTLDSSLMDHKNQSIKTKESKETE